MHQIIKFDIIMSYPIKHTKVGPKLHYFQS